MEHIAWKGRIKPGCVTGAQPKLEQVFRLD